MVLACADPWWISRGTQLQSFESRMLGCPGAWLNSSSDVALGETLSAQGASSLRIAVAASALVQTCFGLCVVLRP